MQGATAGQPIRSAVSGETLRIEGTGFGRSPASASVLFDETPAAPFHTGFTAERMLVTAPLVAAPTSRLRVRIGRSTSSAVRFAVARPGNPAGSPGDATLELFAAVDEYAALAALLGRAVAPVTDTETGIIESAALLDGIRAATQHGLDMMLVWRELQADAAFPSLATLVRTDEMIAAGGLTARVRAMTDSIFGPAGALAAGLGAPASTDALLAGGLTELLAGAGLALIGRIATLLREHAKAFEGIENLLKSVTPSISAGIGAGVEGSIDVTVNIGEFVSGLGKLIDALAQWLGLVGPGGTAQLLEAIGRLEEKADRQAGDTDRVGQAIDRIVTDVARLEEKADRTGVTVARTGEAVDRLEEKADRHEAKADRHEEKADRAEGKADALAARADRIIEAVGQLESKADRQEQKSDRLETKADSLGVAIGRVEAKADRIENRAERLEAKADTAESKLDRLESKADRLERKSDVQERKADRLEAKADRLEQKADRQEAKADRLEGKADRLEGKVDRVEVKLDRMAPLVRPHGTTVASQRGGGPNVSAVVAAADGATDRVFLRVAANVPAAALDDPTRFTPWIDFGRPANAQRLLVANTDLKYANGSNTVVEGLLTVRDAAGRVFHRAFQRGPQARLAQPAAWTAWIDGLGSPP